MARGEELGVGYVTLTVSTKGMGKDIAKQFKDAEKQASTSGKKMGQKVSDEFNKNVDLSEMQRKVEIAEARATKAVEDGAKAQAVAREKAEAAAAKQALAERRLTAERVKAENAAKQLVAAERRYQEALDQSGAESAEAAKAERDLDAAREKAADTTARHLDAENKLADAKQRSVRESQTANRVAKESAEAQDKLQKELHETKRAFDEASEAAKRGGKDAEENYRDGWRGLSSKLGRQVSHAVGEALDKVNVVARGVVHGTAYAQSFSAAVRAQKIASPVASLAGLSGVRVLSDAGSGLKNFMGNLDRAVPKIAGVSLAIAGIGSAAMGSIGAVAGLAAALGSIAAVGLALPALFTGLIGGIAVLSMAMADASEVLKDLGPGFKALQDNVSAAFWAKAAEPIRNLTNAVLPLLNTELSRVADGFGHWVIAIEGVVNSARGLGLVETILGYLADAVDISGEGIAAMTSGLLELTAVGASYLPNLAGWFNDISASFEAWVQKSTASGEIFAWIDTGIENLKALGSILWNTIGVFHALAEAATNAGSGGLVSLADGMEALNKAMHGPVFQGALTNVLIGAGIGLDHIGAGLSHFGGTLAALAPTISAVLGLAGEAIGGLIEGVSTAFAQSGFATGLHQMFQGIRDGVANLQPAFAPLGEFLGALMGVIGEVARVLGDVFGTAIELLGPPLTRLLLAVQPLVPVLGEFLVNAIHQVAPLFSFLAGVLSPVIGFIADLVGWLSDSMQYWGPFALGIGIVVGLLAGLTGIVTAFSVGLAAINWPIVLIVGALGLLAGAIIYAWNNFDWFRNGVTAVWDHVKWSASTFVTWFSETAVPWIQGAISNIGDFFSWLWTGVIQPVWSWISQIIGGFVNWLTEVVVPWIQGALSTLGDVFTWLYVNIVQPVWNGILIAITAVAAVLVTIWQGLVWFVQNVLGPIFTWLYVNIVQPVWNGIRTFIYNAWLGIQTVFNWIKQGLQWLGEKFQTIGRWISDIWTWLGNVLNNGWRWVDANVLAPFKQGLQWLGDKFRSIGNWIRDIWNWLINTLRNGWAWVDANVLAPFKHGLQWLGDKFRSIGTWIGNIWDWVRDKLHRGWSWINAHVFDPFKRGLQWLGDAFDRTQGGIAKAWDKLRDAVKKPVAFVVNHVVNPFLNNYNKINDFWSGDDIATIDGFARGGVLPGYQSRKRDDLLTPMRSGEGVLVPEVVRGIGAQTVHALNAAGNSGGVGAVRDLWRSGGLARGDNGESQAGPRIGGHEDEAHAGPPGGPSGGLWGSIQTAMNRSGRLYVPDTSVRGGNVAEAAKAWMGQSALDIVVGNGSPGVRPQVGHRGPWGFADTMGNLEISTSTPGNRVMGTIIHELGHILSLGHPAGGYGATGSVMSAGMAGGDWPHAIDYQVLRSVWGKPGDGVTRYSASDVEGVTASSISPMDWIREKLDKYVTGPIKEAKEKFGGNKFVQIGTGLAGKMFDGIKTKAAELLGKLPGFSDAVDAGKKVFNGVANKVKVTAWITEALAKKGLANPGNIASGVARAFKESGGDPNIVQQIQDQNSGGNEARGLMQVIPPTFKANMEPGHGNIYDPVDNILASINYTLKRYGSVRAGWDQPGGYALGGIVDDVWDDPVGTRHALRPGVSTIYNGTGQVEHFQRVDSGEPVTEGQQINVNVQSRDGEDPTAVGRRVGEALAFNIGKVLV